jgi:hypothetical protein
MKGPLGRLRHQAKREWRCPVCDRREFTGGDVVHRQCDCLAHNDPPRLTWMMLVEEPRKAPAPAPAEPLPRGVDDRSEPAASF